MKNYLDIVGSVYVETPNTSTYELVHAFDSALKKGGITIWFGDMLPTEIFDNVTHPRWKDVEFTNRLLQFYVEFLNTFAPPLYKFTYKLEDNNVKHWGFWYEHN